MQRMLFIAHRIPYPPDKGDKIRSFNELKALSKDYEIDLVTFVDYKKDYQNQLELYKYCSKIFVYKLNKFYGLFKALAFFLSGKSLSEGYYYKYRTHKKIKELVEANHYNIIFCFSAQIAQYVLGFDKIKRVMDFVDVDSDKWLQYSKQKKFPFNIIYKAESNRLLDFEKRISQKFSLSIFSTIHECNIFNNLGGKGQIVYINNGVDSVFFSPQNIQKENALIFVGAMDYFPNIDAVKWFVEEVFILVSKQLENLKFLIVGSNPGAEVEKLKALCSNITVTGFVDDIRIHMAKAKMAVIPIRIARGIQNKILEAMAMGLPVIINEKLFSSLSNLDREMVFIYKDAEDLQKMIKENVGEDEKLSLMGKKLREYVVLNYNWDNNLDKMKRFLLSC